MHVLADTRKLPDKIDGSGFRTPAGHSVNGPRPVRELLTIVTVFFAQVPTSRVKQPEARPAVSGDPELSATNILQLYEVHTVSMTAE
jgi:hypothetical protein